MVMKQSFLLTENDFISVAKGKVMTLIISRNKVIVGVSQSTSTLSLASPNCSMLTFPRSQTTGRSILWAILKDSGLISAFTVLNSSMESTQNRNCFHQALILWGVSVTGHLLSHQTRAVSYTHLRA